MTRNAETIENQVFVGSTPELDTSPVLWTRTPSLSSPDRERSNQVNWPSNNDINDHMNVLGQEGRSTS